ncbi:SpoIIE family protein phosphatase [Streptomyces sp. NPDC002187]|uniref:SpoIIE family protein phosphatase n=1 Tax=Streptomyces sp. NPDC002187 TaxID=3364637 RepID=UPI0036A7F94F
MTGRSEKPGDAGLLDGTLAAIVRRSGASAGNFHLLVPEERLLCLTVVCGLPVEFTAPWRRVPLSAPVPVADAVREDRLVWVGSQESMVRAYPRAAAVLPYRLALAAVPVSGVRRCWGALVLLWPADHPAVITRRERSHLAASARRLARLLDEAPRPPAVPHHPRIVSVLPADPGQVQPAPVAADFAERLPGGSLSLDLDGRITFCTPSAAELLGRSADQLLGTLPWQALPWLDDPVPEEQYRTAVISREPVCFTALRPPDQWLDFRLYPDPSGISVRINPSRAPGPHPQEPTGGSRQLPDAVRAGRLHQLVHLAAALTETVGVRDVVDLAADQILPAFGADGLILAKAEAGRLKITGYRGYDPQIIERLDGLPLDTDLTPTGRALASGLPSFFANSQEMARLYPRTPTIGVKQAWAFLPLIISGRPVGCCILSYNDPHAFTADERAVLTSLAGLIAQALDRARLYDAKKELAHGLQQALLPRALPDIRGLDVAARYLPASHGMDVGGDFYDLIRLTDTTAAAFIGDVQGHNVTAAALMGQVRTAVRSHATADAPPGEILARTNRTLTDLEPDLLVSCLYTHIDLGSRRISLASAGHVPPILRHPRHAGEPAQARVLQVEPGPLLGIDIDAVYPVAALSLAPGDILALYTDGLVEIPGADLSWTTADLARHLADSGDLPLDQLVDSLVHHAWPTGRHTDDIALLLLQPSVSPSV